ncbi:FAD1 flavin adenine dinucleotide synthetase [Allomyces javanicus]|nr:FAD1 flavin adenine dinucleotide synthetase [Allomyces javanicus]
MANLQQDGAFVPPCPIQAEKDANLALDALAAVPMPACCDADPTPSTPRLFPPIDFAAVERDVYAYVTRTTLGDAAPAASHATSMPEAAVARLQAIITDAVGVLEAALHQFTPKHLALSFNGGKDCTVLLHLLAAVLHRGQRLGAWDQDASAVQTVYVMQANGFDEEHDFVAKCAARYNLAVDTLPGPMQSALATYTDRHPLIRAVCVGTRRTDPWASHLRPMHKCDPGWPELVRVHPVLDWAFADIWLFLLALRVEYCVLYDHGYTSLGPKDRTVPNPDLKKEDGSGGYWPAWRLRDSARERCGRMPAASKPAAVEKGKGPATTANGAASA